MACTLLGRRPQSVSVGTPAEAGEATLSTASMSGTDSTNSLATHEMTVGAASDVLSKNYHKDYHKYFDAVCRDLQRSFDSSFKQYVDMIRYDPLYWLNSFPANLRSRSAFSKPKTAVLNLLQHAEVRCSLGDEYCSRAAKDIEQAFKLHANNIVRSRARDAARVVGTAHGTAHGSRTRADDAQDCDLDAVRAKLDDLKAFVVRLAEAAEDKDLFRGEALRELMARW